MWAAGLNGGRRASKCFVPHLRDAAFLGHLPLGDLLLGHVELILRARWLQMWLQMWLHSGHVELILRARWLQMWSQMWLHSGHVELILRARAKEVHGGDAGEMRGRWEMQGRDTGEVHT